MSVRLKRWPRASLSSPTSPGWESDCVVCQAGGRVAHKVHSLWDGGKNPGCGLVDNSPLLHAGVWHGDLHKVSVLIIALSITISLRMTATRATFLVLPRASSRS